MSNDRTDDKGSPPKKSKTMLIVLVSVGAVIVLGVALMVYVITNLRQDAERRISINDMKLIGYAYLQCCTNKKPPENADDLKPLLPTSSEAATKLTDGSIVVLYGVGLADLRALGADKVVLAHEKGAPEKGGLVLLCVGLGNIHTPVDIQVEKMTAAEFTAMPKARKKPKE